jgi:hypothetical protein
LITDDAWARWFGRARQVVALALGVVLVVYSLVSPGKDIAYTIAGLVMVGTIPLQAVLPVWVRRHGEDGPTDEVTGATG